jgi:hypothetical protein
LKYWTGFKKILLLFLGISLHVVRIWNGARSPAERVQPGRLTIQTSFCSVETDWTKAYSKKEPRVPTFHSHHYSVSDHWVTSQVELAEQSSGGNTWG